MGFERLHHMGADSSYRGSYLTGLLSVTVPSSCRKCDECDFLNMGMYTKVKNYAGLSQRVSGGHSGSQQS